MPVKLRPERYYHVYNRGNGGENLFRTKRNYHYFLNKYAHYVEPVAQTFAYCLMKNHFHLLVRVRPAGDASPEEEEASQEASRQFSHLFNSYTKSVNRAWGRTGNLFERPFKRKEVESETYFAALVRYIHHNPQAHGFVEDFRTWPHSSYPALRGTRSTRLQRAMVMEWFGGQASFHGAHGEEVDDGDAAAMQTTRLDAVPAMDVDFEMKVEK